MDKSLKQNMLKETIYRIVFKNWQKFNTLFRDMHDKEKQGNNHIHTLGHTISQDTKKWHWHTPDEIRPSPKGCLDVSLGSGECFPDLPCPKMQH